MHCCFIYIIYVKRQLYIVVFIWISCDDHQLTLTWITLACPSAFTVTGNCVSETNLTSTLFICVAIKPAECAVM
jgi:hypothetical protein